MALIPLSKTDPSRLHPDAFDVRGWEVRTEADDEHVGSVEDVLLDTSGLPHLLDVDLGTFRKHVLVPLGQARADPSSRVVWVERVTRDDVQGMPEYGQEPDALTPEMEERLARDYRTAAGRHEASGGRSREREGGTERLARLDAIGDLAVAKGSSDPRGWAVLGGDGVRLGTVKGLVVDRDAMRVRYLDVDVDEAKLSLERVDRHVLLPIDQARLEHKGRKVVVDGLFARDMADYPVYPGLPLPRGYERDVAGRFRSGAPPSEEWPERAARRFFGGARRRGTQAEEAGTGAGGTGEGATGEGASATEASPEKSTVVRPMEGEEIRIRVNDGEVVIERQMREEDRG